MTDKQKIKEEIERRLRLLRNGDADTEVMKRVEGVIKAYKSILDFIDSLPEEPVSEDLEDEIENYIKDSLAIKFPTTDKEQIKADIRYIARHFAEWQKQKDLEDSLKSDLTMPNKFYEKGKADVMKEMKETLQTEYEKGRFDMREELMKNTVLETEVLMDCDGDGIETPYQEWLTLEDTEIPYIPDNLGLKEGDKVKIIIIKEEKK